MLSKTVRYSIPVAVPKILKITPPKILKILQVFNRFFFELLIASTKSEEIENASALPETEYESEEDMLLFDLCFFFFCV